MITTDSKALREAVKVAAMAISRRTSLPVLGMVHLAAADGTLTVSGTDLEVAVSRTVAAEGSGAFCVAPKELMAALPKKGGVTLGVEYVESRRPGDPPLPILSVGAFTIRATLPADKYPVIPAFEAEWQPVEGFASALRWASLAAADNEARPILHAVRFDGRHVVGADNYRLHIAALDAPECVLSLRPAELLAKIAPESVEVAIMAARNQFGARWDGTLVVGRLVDGHYPNWQQVIPVKYDAEGEVSAPALEEAVKAASVIARTAANVVVLSAPDSELIVSAKSDSGEVATPLPFGPYWRGAAVNVTYLGLALDRHDGTVKLSGSGPLSPVRIDHPDGRYAVLMPIRTPEVPVAAAA